ncbi:MAG: SdrD B-like domain-containing protein [Bacteroidota bacterium]
MLTLDLGYEREGDSFFGTSTFPEFWQPWKNVWGDVNTVPAGTNTVKPIDHAPILMDIEFTEDGSMIIGLGDRLGDQVGNSDPVPEAGSTGLAVVRNSGDILKACYVNGVFVMEGTAGSCTVNDQNPNSGLTRNIDGYSGNGEFFYDEFYRRNDTGHGHAELALGGLAVLPGTGEVVAVVYDPDDFNTQGVERYSTATGALSPGGTIRIANTATTVGKANGLGDTELFCDPFPIQIGNYVWIDEDEDGVQDACEPPLEGVTVKLYRKPSAGGDPVELASIQTDDNGNYYFVGDQLDNATWTVSDTISADSTYFVAFCGDGTFNDTDNTIEVDGTTYCLTTANTGEGNNPDLNDSDATAQALGSLGTFPAYCTQPGEVDTTNHTFDVGFKPTEVFDLALVKRLDTGTTPGPFAPGDEISFEIEVYNQGDIDATDIEVKDYIPNGLTLAAVSTTDWNTIADTAVLATPIATLQSGNSTTLSITFTIDQDYMADSLVNVAEISSFDDDNDPMTDPLVDEDSTPNDNGDDDPELMTDDDIDDDGDGTPGMEDNPNDEDDFDPVLVPIVQTFDLALIKKVDTVATPGPYTFGSTVTYAIEVSNQGTLDATDVVVSDYIPEGLSLVASTDWTQVMDTAVWNTPFNLAAGERDTLSISFTIDLDFTGAGIVNTAEITGADNALDLPDEDSTPADNGSDPAEVNTDNEEDDDGPNGNGNPDDPNDEDDFDFARVSLETVSLGSTVFLDNNNDGLQNGVDTGIAIVEVQLFDAATMTQVLTDAAGVRVFDAMDAAPTLTDANGDYHFTNLIPGDYYVVIPTAPATAPLSSNNTGIAFTETDPDDNLDNDDEGVQPGGSGASVSSDTITLSIGDEPVNGTGTMDESAQGNMQDDAFDSNGNMTVDFGFFAPVSIGDTAFVDLDNDGLQGAMEPGIANVMAMVYDNATDLPVDFAADGTAYTPMTMTAVDGSYGFDNLPPGE